MSPVRTKGLLLVLATAIAVAGTAAPAAAKKHKKASTPAPIASGGGVAPGYYLMSGNRVVSQPYPNVAACYKDLAKIKQQMVPGSDTLVCVHRTQ